jgi:hypothetical protein
MLQSNWKCTTRLSYSNERNNARRRTAHIGDHFSHSLTHSLTHSLALSRSLSHSLALARTPRNRCFAHACLLGCRVSYSAQACTPTIHSFIHSNRKGGFGVLQLTGIFGCECRLAATHPHSSTEFLLLPFSHCFFLSISFSFLRPHSSFTHSLTLALARSLPYSLRLLLGNCSLLLLKAFPVYHSSRSTHGKWEHRRAVPIGFLAFPI